MAPILTYLENFEKLSIFWVKRGSGDQFGHLRRNFDELIIRGVLTYLLYMLIIKFEAIPVSGSRSSKHFGVFRLSSGRLVLGLQA